MPIRENQTSRFLKIAASVSYIALRYVAAYLMMSYGFAKIMGAQFTVIDSQLDRPMGEVNHFWLTWYFFGLSPVYGTVIALAQICGGVLLVFRRTALLGACILAPVVANILMIDLILLRWHLSDSAVYNALIVLLAVLVVFAVNWQTVLQILWPARQQKFQRWQKIWLGVQCLSVILLLTYTAKEAYWIANVNNRAPTPIDGAWIVDPAQSASSANNLQVIYFEYNRAFMCIFRDNTNHYQTHDFRIDPDTHSLRITQGWLKQGPEIFTGTYNRQGDSLLLTGKLHNIPVTITLKRKPMPVKDHQ